MDVVALEAVQEGEEDGVRDVGGEMFKVEVREGVGVERADRLVWVGAGHEHGEAVGGNREQ